MSPAEILAEPATPEIFLVWQQFPLAWLLPLLQQGFEIQITANSTVWSVLCQDLGLPPEYVDTRIQTVFLDGQPVDSLAQGRVAAGATLALSAAMPGLVGAILRRGSFYAAMRQEITYRSKEQDSPAEPGLIKLKLFNLLATELGPHLAARGIWLSRQRWQELLEHCPPDSWSGLLLIRWNGQEMSLAEMVAASRSLAAARVRLVVQAREVDPLPGNRSC